MMITMTMVMVNNSDDDGDDNIFLLIGSLRSYSLSINVKVKAKVKQKSWKLLCIALQLPYHRRVLYLLYLASPCTDYSFWRLINFLEV